MDECVDLGLEINGVKNTRDSMSFFKNVKICPFFFPSDAGRLQADNGYSPLHFVLP